MIVTEFYREREDGVILNITYSDIHHYIISDENGAKYESAIDPAYLGRTYHESDEVIPDESEDN